ncbi:hypothetical protein [Parasphingorhabdus pacifica]
MSSTTELADIQRALTQLRTGVSALRSRYGDVPSVRRISNDVERLDIDVNDLSAAMPAPRRGSTAPEGETVIVPDTPYDPELWRGVDDEGLGGQHGR